MLLNLPSMIIRQIKAGAFLGPRVQESEAKRGRR